MRQACGQRRHRLRLTGKRSAGLALAAAAALIPAAAGHAAIPTVDGTDVAGNGTSLGVAVDGALALVGQGATATTTNTTPQVAVYAQGANGWTQTATLTPPSTAGWFGRAVALDTATRTAAIGTGSEVDVYVLHKSGNWTLEQQIPAPADMQDPSGGFGSWFGTVAVSGDTLVVGDGSENSAGSGAGAAWVFTRSDDTWTQRAKLTGLAAGDGFGSAVALSGSELLVGAPSASNAGAAYVFSGQGSSWTAEATLTDATNVLNRAPRQFGTSVSIDGGTAVIGEPNNIGTGCIQSRCDIGAAWVFGEVPGTTAWTAQAELTSHAFQDGGTDLGESVSVSQGRVVVGAPASAPQTFAYVWTSPAPGVWAPAEELASPSCDLFCGLGQSVSTSGGVELVSAGDADARAYA